MSRVYGLGFGIVGRGGGGGVHLAWYGFRRPGFTGFVWMAALLDRLIQVECGFLGGLRFKSVLNPEDGFGVTIETPECF